MNQGDWDERIELECYESAGALPSAWDTCLGAWRGDLPGGGAIYLERAFLEFLESVNPCGQRYWFSEAAGVLFVTYSLKLNLLNFARFGRLAVPATIVGVPLSVAAPGFATRDAAGRALMSRWIRRQLKGLTVILNVPEGEAFDLHEGLTLSSYVMPLPYEDFEAYMAALRSPYRRQAKRALAAFKGVEVLRFGGGQGQFGGGQGHTEQSGPAWLGTVPSQTSNEVTVETTGAAALENLNLRSPEAPAAFDPVLYPLYLEVFNHSKDQLEKLPLAYFERFPGATTAFVHDGRPLAFVQTLDEVTQAGKTRHFVLGGFDRSRLAAFDLYRNLLLHLIQEAFADGCTTTTLGQTAAESKSKTGAQEQLKYLYLAHSSPVLHKLLGALVKGFSYRRYKVKHHVFK